ncbi:MAG: acyltransferase [Anaerolineae bacterium]|nr:acyltransferase [Gloeobacterales cyanobacterium ES-bin-313]
MPKVLDTISPPLRSDRLFALDLLKAVCIALVVLQHANFLPAASDRQYADILDLLLSPLRFTVPVLLAISLFLLERSLKRDVVASTVLKKRFVRLLIPTLFWFGVAFLIQIRANPLAAILPGIGRGELFIGAYYLLILLQVIPVYLLIRNRLNQSLSIGLLFFQALVYCSIEVLISSHLSPPFVQLLRTIDRPLFLYWFGYMGIGYLLSQHYPAIEKLSAQLGIWAKMGLIALSALMLALEGHWVFKITEGQVRPFNYTMLSCLLSILVAFLCAASVHADHLSPQPRKAIILLSTYSLGIFCINGILSPIIARSVAHFVGTLSFSLPEVLLIKFFGWLGLLIISLLGALALEKIGLKNCVR